MGDLPLARAPNEDHGVEERRLELLRAVGDGRHLAEQIDVGLAQVKPAKGGLGDVLGLAPGGPFALQPGFGPGQLSAKLGIGGMLFTHRRASGQMNCSSQWSPPRC